MKEVKKKLMVDDAVRGMGKKKDTSTGDEVEYIYDKKLLKAMKDNDTEKERSLLSGLSAYEVRDKYDQITNHLLMQRIGTVDKDFINKMKSTIEGDLSKIPVKIVGPNDPELKADNLNGYFSPDSERVVSRFIPSTINHELSHAADYTNNNYPFTPGKDLVNITEKDADVDVMRNSRTLSPWDSKGGLHNAEQRIKGHHENSPIYSRGAAYNLSNNLPYTYSVRKNAPYPESGENYAPSTSETYPINYDKGLRRVADFLGRRVKVPTYLDSPQKSDEYAGQKDYQYTDSQDSAIDNSKRSLMINEAKKRMR